jgi:hypothetical protein
MANFRSKPHVSAALAHLRFGVTGAASVLAVSAAVQLLVFGFVHFTHLRYAQAPHEPAPIRVVAPTPRPAVASTTAVTTGTDLVPTGFVPVAPPRVVDEWDARLHTLSDMTISAAVVAGLLLAVFTVLGVVIAGSSGVPGVERAVSAATWALLIAAACLPWHDIMPSMMFKGAFGDYASMAQLSESVDNGTASVIPLLSAYLAAPMAALCGSLLVLGRFRQGLAEGVIATSMSEIDERLEREMAGIRSSGVGAANTRTVAALNHAIGEKPGYSGPPESLPHPAAAEAPRKRGVFLSRTGRGVMASEDEDFKRPI